MDLFLYDRDPRHERVTASMKSYPYAKDEHHRVQFSFDIYFGQLYETQLPEAVSY